MPLTQGEGMADGFGHVFLGLPHRLRRLSQHGQYRGGKDGVGDVVIHPSDQSLEPGTVWGSYFDGELKWRHVFSVL